MSGDVHARLRRLIDGDREAAAWLYDGYAPGLYRRLKQRYGYAQGPDPADLLHDAFVFFFQNDARVLRMFLERVPDDANADAALQRHLWDLACGLAANRSRAAWGRKMVSVEDIRATSPDAGADRRALARDSLARLDGCLKQSRPSRVYLYYKLRYFDGLSPDEVAAAAGWSRKASYKLKEALNEALRRCSEQLGISS